MNELNGKYTKAELLKVSDEAILEHFPAWSKTFAFDEAWRVWAIKQSADLADLCQAYARGTRAGELVLVAGKMRGLGEEARYIWRHLVARSIGFTIAGVDRVLSWSPSPARPVSDRFLEQLDAEDRAARGAT